MPTEPAVAAPLPAAADHFGRYEILHKLATGGMGEVFLARSVGAAGFQKHVVIKKLLPHLVEQEQFVEGLIREAKLLVRLDHPNIVQVLDLGVEGSDYFMAMEYVHGYNLATIIHYAAQNQYVIPAVACATIAEQVLAGLEFAHALVGPDGETQNVVHRDVSPQNVLISTEGRVKLTDFGIAKVVNEAEGEHTQSLKGKFRYMAPEVVEGGRIDQRYDLFAVGILLFEALCRRHLFSGTNDINILAQVRKCHIPPIARYHPNVSRELALVVEKGLAKEPEERFQTAGEFAGAIREALQPTTEAEAQNTLRSFIGDLYSRPDFPINKPKIPDLNAPFGQSITRSIVLHSRLAAAGPGRGRAPLVVLALGLLLVSGVVAYLGYMLLLKPKESISGKPPVIIVEPRPVVEPRPADARTTVARRPDLAPSVEERGTGRKKPERRGPFDGKAAATVFARQGAALKRCFKSHTPGSAGEVRVKIASTIEGPTGRVTETKIEPGAVGETPLGKCLLGVARRVRYARHDRSSIIFNVPVTLKRTE